MDSEIIARVREKLEEAVKGHDSVRVLEALGEVASLLPQASANPYAALLASDSASHGDGDEADAPLGMAPARTIGVIEPGFEVAEASASALGAPFAPRRTRQSIAGILQHDPSASSVGTGWSSFDTTGVDPLPPADPVMTDATGTDKLALVGPLLVRWIGDGLERMVEERLRFQAQIEARAGGDARRADAEIAAIENTLDGWTTRMS